MPTPPPFVSNAPEASSTTRSPYAVLIAIGIGTFMAALDGSVVNVTLPVVTQALKSTIAASEWVITIYLLVLSGLLLSFGRLGDLQGHKRIYLAGFAVFVAASALCGLSTSVPMLVFFRALQAIGAAMLSANSPAILTKSFPPHKRGQALGLQATMTYLGLTVGPSLGGWLTETWSWRAVFYINVPVGLIAFLLSLRYIADDQPHAQTERFDWQGAGAFMAGLTLLLFGMNQGHALGWTSPVIIGSLALALAVLGFFVYLQAHVTAPMLDLSLFASRVFSGSTLSAVLNYICVNTITFLTPFYLLQGRGLRPAEAGLLLTAMPVIMAIVAPISGTLSDRIGARLPAMLGMFLLAAGLWSLAGLGPDTSWAGIAWRLALAGLGTGIFISPNTSALMGAAPRGRQGIASGILATARNFGMVLGVGLAGAIFTSLAGATQAPDPQSVIAAIRMAYQVAAGVALAGLLLAALKPRHIPTPK